MAVTSTEQPTVEDKDLPRELFSETAPVSGVELESAQSAKAAKEKKFQDWFKKEAARHWKTVKGVQGNLNQKQYEQVANAIGRCYFLLRFALIMKKRQKLKLVVPFSLAQLQQAYRNVLFLFRVANGHRGWYSPGADIKAFKQWFNAGMKAMMQDIAKQSR